MTNLSERKFKKGDFVRVTGFSHIYYGIINRYERNHIIVDAFNLESDSFSKQLWLQECHLGHLSEKDKLILRLKYIEAFE